ncbi:PREDICTED: G-protein coupled receptor family C group 5 member C, partial [Charadrius vociferus]|uniref:G-protein coupled receptor family C group 5 member C n=1 Tax=Charadrius vociferus TaxID=50402 RepID=UPI0005212663
VFFLLGTFGLFCLTFDFIVGPDFSTCTSRRFLFGVLFGICFSCLLAHAVALNFLARRNRGPRGWVTLAVALLLTLVEVIINAEWLIITVARQEGGSPDPCRLEDTDFVMALIYVMFLLVAAFCTAWPALCGHYGRWRKHSPFILATTGLSIAIWVAWTAMYLYGNQHAGEKPGWDDPTLAIALVSNACAFLLLYVIPEVTHVTRLSPEQAFEDDIYPTRGVGYETILKEQKSQSMFVENKAFSMDEPSFGRRRRSLGTLLPHSGAGGGYRHRGWQRRAAARREAAAPAPLQTRAVLCRQQPPVILPRLPEGRELGGCQPRCGVCQTWMAWSLAAVPHGAGLVWVQQWGCGSIPGSRDGIAVTMIHLPGTGGDMGSARLGGDTEGGTWLQTKGSHSVPEL